MLKKIQQAVASFLLAFGPLFVFAPIAHAVTDICTWTGTTNNNFNTASNWNCSIDGAAAPENGDSLVFINTALSADTTLTNDIGSASFDAITFQGSGTDSFTIAGNGFTSTGAITNNATDSMIISAAVVISGSHTISAASGNLRLTGALSGSGAINKTGSQILILEGNSSSYSGNITVSAGELWASHVSALGDATGTTTVNDDTKLLFELTDMGSNPTIAEPITISGDGGGQGFTEYALAAKKCFSSECNEDVTLTLSGNITLAANTKVAPGHELKLTGGLSGTFTITVGQGNPGKLIVQSNPNTSSTLNGTYEAPLANITLSDNQASTPVTINYNETYIVNGTRQSISVNEGGTLKGTGTVGTVSVEDGGTIAPGESPGCLSTGNLTFASGSTYDFEVGGNTACTGYDQIKVTGTVSLGTGTLNLILFNNFEPTEDENYTIIDNDAADAVTGTFADLAEGETFEVDGYVFAISYVGGDGNDVTVTTQSIPGVPETGFQLLTSHPIVTLTVVSFLAVSIVVIAKRYSRT